MHETGFNLFELLMVLLITAVIMLIGAPALQQLTLGQHMTSQVNSFVHAVVHAKYAAHTRLQETVLCKSLTGQQCEPEAEWHDPWLLFVNRNQDYPPQRNPDEPILLSGASYQQGTITANRAYFIFRPFEIRSTNGTLVFCDRRGSEAATALIISYTGRPRIARTRANAKPLNCPS
ncbi:MAG: GspH/FimT family pseudopilin [Gammaproteobacteria bacterium]|nr:GspH/FimT family pseudopilin [Gammaproteobacteria bacterium]